MTTPKLAEIIYTATNYDPFSFRISGIDVSFINAIRRTVLSDIQVVVLRTENHGTDVDIELNTSKIHNEILKHRLSCIPVFCDRDAMASFVDTYELVVEEANTTSDLFLVTTQHFRIRNKKTGSFLPAEEQRKHFPPDPITKDYILFNRLLPQIGYSSSSSSSNRGAEGDDDHDDDARGGKGGGGGGGGAGAEADVSDRLRSSVDTTCIPCEKIKLRADFGISCARENACFNVVSLCTYSNSPNDDAIHDAWTKYLETHSFSREEVAFERKNFMALNALQIFIPNSFDFRIQSLGMLHGRELIQTACDILLSRLHVQEENVKSNYPELVEESQTTIDNGFDIRLLNEDYTLGMMLEYIGYEKFYLIGRAGGNGSSGGKNEKKDAAGGGGREHDNDDDDDGKKTTKILNFFAFQKAHPHNHFSTLRIGFYNETTKEDVVKIFCEIVHVAKTVIRKIRGLFDK